jgi:hypothetical protein
MLHKHSELLGFWTLPIVRYFKRLENTTFRKLDLFPPHVRVEGHLLCWIPQKELTSVTSCKLFSSPELNLFKNNVKVKGKVVSVLS